MSFLYWQGISLIWSSLGPDRNDYCSQEIGEKEVITLKSNRTGKKQKGELAKCTKGVRRGEQGSEESGASRFLLGDSPSLRSIPRGLRWWHGGPKGNFRLSPSHPIREQWDSSHNQGRGGGEVMCPACFNLRLQETSLCSGSSWRTKAQEPMKSILPTCPGWKPTSHWGVPGDWRIPQKQNIPPSYLASFCDTIWHRRTLTRVSPAGEECFLLPAIGVNWFPPCGWKPFWSAVSWLCPRPLTDTQKPFRAEAADVFAWLIRQLRPSI